jgi:hypothetical protein
MWWYDRASCTLDASFSPHTRQSLHNATRSDDHVPYKRALKHASGGCLHRRAPAHVDRQRLAARAGERFVHEILAAGDGHEQSVTKQQ